MGHNFSSDVDSIYECAGYQATLLLSPTPVSLLVLDALAGAEVSDGIGMTFTKPALGVRISELTANNLTLIDVINEEIVFQGFTYRIRDARQIPTPGTNSGQAWLILVE